MNETDLRETYRDRVPDEVIDAMHRRLREQMLLDAPRASRRPSRVGPVLGAVAAVAAVVAVAVGLGGIPGGSGDGHRSTPAAGDPAPVALEWTARLAGLPGFETTFRSVTAHRETIGLHLIGSPDTTCSCNDATSTALVTVYRRGFDPASLRDRRATTLDARTAYLGTMPPGDLDAMTSNGSGRFPALAFQYRAGRWATVVGRTAATAQPERLRQVAAGLRVGAPSTIRVPLRLGAPHGLRVLGFTQTVRSDGSRPYSTVVLSTGPAYRGSAALLIRLYPRGADPLQVITATLTRPIAGGTHAGHTDPDVATARTPEAYFRLGTSALVDLSGQGVRGAAFVDLVHRLVWPEHVSADERTWLPASALTQGH